jgi:site-specific DNA-methyltransferase (adenine-specific)
MSAPEPFYQDDRITIYYGDCRKILPYLEGTADCLIADPPYNETALEWDVWPEGWAQAAKVVAPQMWCFGSLRLFLKFQEEFYGWKLAQDLIWEKQNGSSLHSDRFRKVHETIAHWYHGKWAEIPRNPPKISVQERPGKRTTKRTTTPQHFNAAAGNTYNYDGTRLQRSVLQMRNCHHAATNETQKPEGLLRILIEYSTNPGHTIVDPFCGSGTTLAAALHAGRKAIGIDTRLEQCRIAKERCRQHPLLT